MSIARYVKLALLGATGGSTAVMTGLSVSSEDTKRASFLFGAGVVGRMFIGFNKLKMYNFSEFEKQFERNDDSIFRRPSTKNNNNSKDHVGLLTITNHDSTCDGPLISKIIPLRMSTAWDKVCWGVGASDIFYEGEGRLGKTLSRWFSRMKILPIDRKGGVHQDMMKPIIEKLDHGKWVHIFPEGKVSMDGNLNMFKRGVGRILVEAKQPVNVLQFFHSGMKEIQPPQEVALFSFPRQFKEIKVFFDETFSSTVVVNNAAMKVFKKKFNKIDLTKLSEVQLERLYEATATELQSKFEDFRLECLGFIDSQKEN
eukprot:TRINITY_DN2220_c0_g1_i1.p1 TRINITY_DN2220_c0_g1~~TRINITY_DN2220_c0_g1_i1.p1  ORF type:complete len:313 (-),score=70.66 TRINITY_DN2220_c0_g1_i1:198-1136(-)